MTDEPDSVDELISRYLDGEATDAEITRVESDPALLARAESMRAAIEAVAAPVTIPTLDLDRIRTAALAESTTTSQVSDLAAAAAARSEKMQRRARFMAVAAAFVFLAVGAVAIQSLGTSDDDESSDTAAVATSDDSSDSADDGGAFDLSGSAESAEMADDDMADEDDDMEEESFDEAEGDMADDEAAMEAAPESFMRTDVLEDALPAVNTSEELVAAVVERYTDAFDAEATVGGDPAELFIELCPEAADMLLGALPLGVLTVETAITELAGVPVTVVVGVGVDGSIAVLSHPVEGCSPTLHDVVEPG